MRSARPALSLVFAIALAPSPAAAQDAVDDPAEVRVVCVRWNADAGRPDVYAPSENGGCAVAGANATEPPENDALARLDHTIGQLQANIDAIRPTTYAPAPTPLRWQITAAGPNHLYYAARNLLRYTRDVAGAHDTCRAPSVPTERATTLDVVIDIVACVNNQLRQRLERASNGAASGAPQQATGGSARRVAARLLERLLVAGRQLDAVLPAETTPSDVYDRLEEVVGNIGGPTAAALPAPSEQAESVADVHRLLFRCLRLSQVLEVQRNLQTQRRSAFVLSQWHGVDVAPNSPSLQIDIAEAGGLANVDLADVHDLATLLAAQLDAAGDGGSAEAVYARPPQPTSTDLLRLARVLEARLIEMTGITALDR